MGFPEDKKYYVAGHSLGGYLSSVYALEYQHEIIKLILLSPVGIPEKPEDYSYENLVRRQTTFTRRMGIKLMIKLWDNSYSPFSVLRFGGNFGTSKFLNMYLRNRMKCLQI